MKRIVAVGSVIFLCAYICINAPVYSQQPVLESQPEVTSKDIQFLHKKLEYLTLIVEGHTRRLDERVIRR